MKLGPFWRKRYSLFHEFLRKIFTFLDWLVWFLFDFSKFKIIKIEKIDKILVVYTYKNGKINIGSAFCTLGAMLYFKELYPNVKVSFMLDKKLAKVFGNFPNIDIVTVEKKQDLKKIKKENFKAVLLFHPSFFKKKDFSFIPYRLTFSRMEVDKFFDLRNRFGITRKIFYYRGMHMMDLNFEMLESLGFKFKQRKGKFYYSPKEDKKVDNFLKKNKVKKFIVIHPGGKGVANTFRKGKCSPFIWSFERYGQVAKYFRDKGYSILVTGSKEEDILAKEIERESRGRIVNCCGNLSIREVGALLDKAELLLSVDTSVVHVGYLVGVPIVELMGIQNPKVYGPWPLSEKRHRILFDNGPCAFSNKTFECPEDIPCMDNIKTKDVISNCEKILELKKQNKI